MPQGEIAEELPLDSNRAQAAGDGRRAQSNLQKNAGLPEVAEQPLEHEASPTKVDAKRLQQQLSLPPEEANYALPMDSPAGAGIDNMFNPPQMPDSSKHQSSGNHMRSSLPESMAAALSSQPQIGADIVAAGDGMQEQAKKGKKKKKKKLKFLAVEGRTEEAALMNELGSIQSQINSQPSLPEEASHSASLGNA